MWKHQNEGYHGQFCENNTHGFEGIYLFGVQLYATNVVILIILNAVYHAVILVSYPYQLIYISDMSQ